MTHAHAQLFIKVAESASLVTFTVTGYDAARSGTNSSVLRGHDVFASRFTGRKYRSMPQRNTLLISKEGVITNTIFTCKLPNS